MLFFSPSSLSRKPTNPHLNSRNEQSSPIQNHRDQDVRSITTNSSVESRDQLRNNSGNDSATSLNSNTTSNHSLSNANNETNLITSSQRNFEQVSSSFFKGRLKALLIIAIIIVIHNHLDFFYFLILFLLLQR